MPAPLIGISTRNTTSETYKIPLISSPRSYIEALSKAGALPVLIPLGLPENQLKELITSLDAVVFTGGGDIETELFIGEDHPEVTGVDKERDNMELQLVHDVLETQMLFLAICRGIQVLNVAMGGTLYTHIADQLPGAVEHTFFPGYPWDHMAHTVQLEEGSRLAEIVDTQTLPVNSLHHQGVRELASGLRATGYSPDGLVEAAELPEHPFGLAVQWHPEWLPDDPKMQALFSTFVEAARVNKS
ncbi:MAG: gamma-glutamyl-gamma-aminobutyrate hydrolase family protein [Chloroflexi bacterium]|nr:gamma-glutamyl-gamma-aminobutyrate hydrolase family protein [Chloroflexota bacterium]